MTTAKGIMMVAKRARNSRFFHLKFIFAKAKAARDDVKPPISRTGISTQIVLMIPELH